MPKVHCKHRPFLKTRAIFAIDFLSSKMLLESDITSTKINQRFTNENYSNIGQFLKFGIES